MENYLYINFELYYPSLVCDVVKYRETGPGELRIKLQNGDVIIYNDFERTVRTLPRDGNHMSEVECCKEFGKRLSMVMRRKGITQRDLSDLTGIPQPVISGYITGKHSPSFYKVDKIAKALHCSVDELRYLEED